jgi:hypothetical protein
MFPFSRCFLRPNYRRSSVSALLGLVLLLLAAGTQAASAPPTGLPVMDFPALPAKADAERYVLRVPANTDIPVAISLGGELLSTAGQAELRIRLRQDLFVWRELVSVDRQVWRPVAEAFAGHLSMGLEPRSAGGGELRVQLGLDRVKQ